MAESSPNEQKTLWKKKILLVMSNFSFSHSVFKRLVLQTRKNQGLFGKGLKIRFGFHQRATDLSLRAVAKHQMACCMRYSLIQKVQSFTFQSRKVVLSLESFTGKMFLFILLISVRNADRAPVSAASNYSMITHRPINPLRYRNI